MLKIGLTGGIGSGKSVVSELFTTLGVPVIDTDVIARELVTPSSPALAEIISHFGKQIIDNTGNLNRRLLAQIVFTDEAKRKQLESILHPRINQEVQHRIQQLELSSHTETDYVIIVIPLLFEANLTLLVDKTLVVDSNKAQQIERVHTRDHRNKDDIQNIIDSQIDSATRLALADNVISNKGTLEQLKSRVLDLHRYYLKNSNNPRV